METTILRRSRDRWDIVDDNEAAVAYVHEGRDRPDDFTVLAAADGPAALNDLDARRFSSINAVAEAVGVCLKGACRVA